MQLKCDMKKRQAEDWKAMQKGDISLLNILKKQTIEEKNWNKQKLIGAIYKRKKMPSSKQ